MLEAGERHENLSAIYTNSLNLPNRKKFNMSKPSTAIHRSGVSEKTVIQLLLHEI